MTKQSKISSLWQIASLSLAMTLLVGSALAQDEYVPPPMFDAPAMNAQVGENVLRRFEARRSPYQQPQTPTATPPPEQRYTGVNNPLLPPVVTKGDPALEKAKPVVQPQAPRTPKAVETVRAPLPVAKPQIAAPTIQATTATPPPKADAMPAARVTSKGVVTGPKTMPSVPTTGVVVEKTFEEDKSSEPTLMERHQAASMTAPVIEPVIEPEKPATTSPQPVLADIPAVAVSPAQKLTIAFERGAAEAADMAVQGVAQALKADPTTRLMIEAYGTAIDEGENGDRRISLARALTLRKAVMAQGIAAHRIDIRTLGRNVTDGSPERADLTVYKG